MTESHLPLTEATFFILLSLATDPKHGYAIMKDVASLSEDRVTFSTSTLYGALKRLLEQNWIERFEGHKSPDTGRIQKHYQLTDLGRRILQADVERLQSLTRAAQMRLQDGTI